MKIRNKITVVFLVICMLFNVMVANAASHTVNYVKALTDDYVTISGTVVNGANREVLLRIDYAGHAPSADTDSLEQSVIYQKQTTTDGDGSFTFNVKLNDTANNSYTLRLGVLGDDSDVSETFTFYGAGYRSTALVAIQTAQRNHDAQALKAALDTYYENLYLQTPLFDTYYQVDTDMSETKSLLVNYPQITTIPMLEASLEGVVIVKDLAQATNYEGMQTVFTAYDSALDIVNSTIYQKTYSNLSTDLKRAVYTMFSATPYYTASDICDQFGVSVLNTYLANAVGADSVKRVLSDNEDMLGIVMTDYSLTDAQYLELIGNRFTTLTDVKAKLDELNSGSLPTPPPTMMPPVIDGGGGGGGGGSVAAPLVDQTGLSENATNPNYPFRDMEDYTWAKEATLALYQSGVVNGVGDDNFAPDRAVTREEFLKLIVNGFGISTALDKDVSFGDVYKSQWYYPFVKAGVNGGIINGMDGNIFGIGQKISRQDMVVMLYRAISMKKDLSDFNASSTFDDYGEISEYAKKAVAFAEANAIVNGMGDGNFHPEDSATRAEAAVILYRAMAYLSNNM